MPLASFGWPTLDFPEEPTELPPYSVFIWNGSGWIDQNWWGGERSHNVVCMGNTLTVDTTNFAPEFVYIVPPEETGGFQPPPILYNTPGTMWVGFGYSVSANQPPGYPAGGAGTLEITANGALQLQHRYIDLDQGWGWVSWSELNIGSGSGQHASTGTVINRGYLNAVSEVNIENGSLQVYDGGRVVTTNLGVGIRYGTGTLLLSAPAGEVHVWEDLHIGHYIGTGTVSLVQGTLRVDGTNFVGRLSADGNLACGSGTFTQTGGEAILGTLILSSTSVDGSEAAVNLGAGSLVADSLVVEGFAGKSVFRQTGGTAVFSNALIGPLDLSGRTFSGGDPNGGDLQVTGGSFATRDLLVRSFGAGKVLISNATVRIADSLRVGDDTAGGSLGYVEVWDGARVAVTNLIVGSALGSGSFDHQGGAVTATTVRVSQGGYTMGVSGGTGATLRVTSDAGIRVVTGNTNVTAVFGQYRGAVSAPSLEVNADTGGVAYYEVSGANSSAAIGDVLVSGVSSNLLLVHNGSLTSDRIRVAEAAGSRGYVEISGSGSQVQVTEFSCGSGTATVRQSGGTVDAGAVSMLLSNGSAGYWISGGLLQADTVSGVTLLGGRVVAGSFSYTSDQGSSRQTTLEANQVTAAGALDVRELALGIAPYAASAATNTFGGDLDVGLSMVVGRDHAASVTVSQPVHVREDLDLRHGSTLQQASQYGTVTVDGVARVGADGGGSSMSLRAALTAGTLELGTNASLADLSTEATATLSFHNLAATNGAVNLDWHSPIRVGQAGQPAPGQMRMASGTLNARSLTVGQLGSASVNQEDGSVTLEQDLTLGMAGCSGTYAFSNGNLTVQGNTVVGNSDGGTGVFHQVSGSQVIWGGLTVGKNAGSQGTYTLDAGGGSVNAGALTVGEGGTGHFVQNGGFVHVNNGVDIGTGAGASGDYTMSGAADLRTMMLTVGAHGDAAFHQDGGTVTVMMNMQVGSDGGGALYEITSGTLDAGGASLSVGAGGTLRLKGGLIGDPTTRTVSANTIALESGGALEATGFNNVLRFNQLQNLPAIFGFAGSLQMGNGMGWAAMTLVSTQQVSATTLTVGYQGEATITVSDSASLETQALDIGDMGSGHLLLVGGTVTVHGEINLGRNWVEGEYVQSTGTLAAGDAQINVGAGNTGTFTISGGTAELGTVRVGGDGSGTFTVNGGLVRADAFHVDTTGSLAIQTNGELRVNALTFDAASLGVAGNLSIGHDGGSGSGEVALSAGKSLSSRYLVVGQNADAVFTQTGGSNTVSSSLRIGNEAGASGTYELDGGDASGPNTVVGRYGTGAFVQSGGTHRPDYLYLAYYAGSSGSYSLGGGTLESDVEFIGEASTGTFTQSGGSNTLTYFVYLGYESGGNGQYTLSGGSLASSSLYAGKFGHGTFTQSGGTVALQTILYVAESTGSSGNYTLQGGSLSAPSQYVGYNGAGTFVQSGGTNTSLSLYVGRSASGSGNYLLSGSGNLQSREVYVGYGSTGAFCQSGGTHNVSWSLSLGATKGKSGSYNLTGGELSSPGIYVGDAGIGLFRQSGGYVAATTMNVGLKTSGTGVVEIAGGTLEVGMFSFGRVGSGTLRLQNAAASITVGQTLWIGTNATLSAVPGSTIHMTGSEFRNESTNAAAMAGLANLTLVFEGGASVVDNFEVAGRDFGPDTNGMVLNFTLGTLELGGTDIGQVRLVDAFDNQPGWTGEEVLYVHNLTIHPGSALDLNGLNLYYDSFTGDPGAVTLNGGVLTSVPESGGMVLLAGGALLLGVLRRRSRKG